MSSERICITVNEKKDRGLFDLFNSSQDQKSMLMDFCKVGASLHSENSSFERLFPDTYKDISSMPYEERLSRLFVLAEIALNQTGSVRIASAHTPEAQIQSQTPSHEINNDDNLIGSSSDLFVIN